MKSLFISFFIFLNLSANAQSVSECKCNKEKVEKIIKENEFNKLPKYDDSLNLSKDDFYKLSDVENRMLWFRDIENIEATKFTPFWDDYHTNNYRADHISFNNYYRGKKDIEMAFMLGPNMDLWAFNIFVIKKIEDCYLITWSYYRHARFTSKRYGIIDKENLDKFYQILTKQKTSELLNSDRDDFLASFMDNRNNKSFKIYLEPIFVKDFQFNKELKVIEEKKVEIPPGPDLDLLYNFIDKEIPWINTYAK